MAENAPRWPMMIGTYLEVEGYLERALVGLLGGDVDFKIVGGFVMAGGGGGGRALREPMDSHRSFPVRSTLRIDFAAFGIFRHMPDFKSIMSCLGLG